MGAAWNRRGHLTIGDALYVALAEQVGATLVTSDMKLARSPGLEVPTITP
jgi:predicted nucleic acid-binding protein